MKAELFLDRRCKRKPEPGISTFTAETKSESLQDQKPSHIDFLLRITKFGILYEG
jgi:hypothetical protein